MNAFRDLPLKKCYSQPLAGRFGAASALLGNGNCVIHGGATSDSSGKLVVGSDSVLYDENRDAWIILEASNPPPPAAAHAMAAVDDHFMYRYGGSSPGAQLCPPQLWKLDLRYLDQPRWSAVVTTPESSPGRRYGHALMYLKPNLIVIGGHNGTRPLADVWILNLEEPRLTWRTIRFSNIEPKPRAYHAAAICEKGVSKNMVIVHGGRGEDGCLEDLWGLRRHRDGSWEWVQSVPRWPPPARFQHVAICLGPIFVILGGRGALEGKPMGAAGLDTHSLVWSPFPAASDRYRHVGWISTRKQRLYCAGGFSSTACDTPIQSYDVFDLTGKSFASEVEREKILEDASTPGPIWGTKEPLKKVSKAVLTAIRSSASVLDYKRPRLTNSVRVSRIADSGRAEVPVRLSLDSLQNERLRVGHHFVQEEVVADNELAKKVIQILLQPKFLEKSTAEVSFLSRIGLVGGQQPASVEDRQPSFVEASFPISVSEIGELCSRVLPIFEAEETLLELCSPVRIFGDLHGHYGSMMSFFDAYGSPVERQLSESFGASNIRAELDNQDFLFLGNYVDRGNRSLEVICLLFALKLLYPRKVFLVRGNHEDRLVNSIYGLKQECRYRLYEDPESIDSVWNKLNFIFEYLPLAATINKKVLCIHGGPGMEVRTLSDITSLPRPFSVSVSPETNQEQRVTDLLWSDPTENDQVLGIRTNPTRDPKRTSRVSAYGPDVVEDLLKAADLELIIRSHECVMDGLERFAGGRLITIFSAVNYCGTRGNAGAILDVAKDMQIAPCLILPVKTSVALGLKGEIVLDQKSI